jgi:hypothetical protein
VIINHQSSYEIGHVIMGLIYYPLKSKKPMTVSGGTRQPYIFFLQHHRTNDLCGVRHRLPLENVEAGGTFMSCATSRKVRFCVVKPKKTVAIQFNSTKRKHQSSNSSLGLGQFTMSTAGSYEDYSKVGLTTPATSKSLCANCGQFFDVCAAHEMLVLTPVFFPFPLLHVAGV